MLVTIMVLSSAAVLLAGASAQASVAGGAADGSYGIAARTWDWQALASVSGLVDVILSVPGADARDGATSVMSALGGSGAGRQMGVLGDADGMAALGVRHVFGNSLGGVSASMSPVALEALLAENPSIEAYPDMPVRTMMGESVLDIGADVLWGMSDPYGHEVTGYGITVAVIDTGIDYTHPDLGGDIGPTYKVIGGYDFYNRDMDPMDDNGHGTHVAGIIAADGDLVGVAPNAKLLAYKALGSDGSGRMSDVIAAIDAAIDPDGDGDTSDRVDIISMSLGGQGEVGDPVCVAVERAVAAGTVVVVAAGNSGPTMNTVASPGVSPDAITVGAVDGDGVLASFSSRGPTPDMTIKPDISAPGVGIVSTVPFADAQMSSATGYMAMSGTSMATPHVSGAAALLLQLHPDWPVDRVRSALVTGASELDEPVWTAGSGQVWLPASADAELFFSQPVVSYGLIDGPSQTVSVTNTGSSVSISFSSSDWFSLYADGDAAPTEWTNASSVLPATVSIASGSTGSFTLAASVADALPEGYYEGEVALATGARTYTIHFGFVILSKLTVHVANPQGNEVFDPYGGVWVFDLPDAGIAMGLRGNIEPSPPATFFLPSGTYSVHSIGHQLLYTYSDPYILSATVTLDRVEERDLWLNMSDADKVTLDLETDDGVPIYVKDYRVYCRHEGATNISFDVVGSDYSVVGPEVFSIKRSADLYISDTEETIGVSIAGFSYSGPMWTFMELNWDHWFEYVSGTSTQFMVEASADEQYLLSWEFEGSAPDALSLDPALTGVYETKYDIPGAVLNPWCDWGTHRAMGGDATFFVRRDTDTSLNPFFSGLTRTTFVQGVFSELYYPYSIFEGFVERQFYQANYTYMLDALTLSTIKVPDRHYLDPLPAATEYQRIGAGPYYPSLYTANTDDSMVLYQPLLRDQAGSKVGGAQGPSMTLYRGGALVGIYSLSEYLARPDAVRVVGLPDAGTYTANISYHPTSQVTDDVVLELGFTVPSEDADPPRITGMSMPQRFVPGEGFDILLEAEDASGDVTVQMSWRPDGAGTWTAATVDEVSDGVFGATITTSPTDGAVDLRITLTDACGNYLKATLMNAALRQIPIEFELYPVDGEVPYRGLPATVVLEGALTDGAGDPLSDTAGIPLELTVDGEKVGMLLDEHVTTTHAHDGTIRFEWVVDPLELFAYEGETVTVSVGFDLGVYQPVTRTLTLTSTEYANSPPTVTLVSPGDSSLIAAGTTIDLEVSDDGAVAAEAFLDGVSLGAMAEPWDVSTELWEDGVRMLTVVATDDVLAETTANFFFDVDGTAPAVEILYPADGSTVPRNGTLSAEVSDAHLSAVAWSLDGGPAQTLAAPYEIDMSGWATGTHTVEVSATDQVGLTSSDAVEFDISDRAIVINVASPEDGAVVNSGTSVEFYVLGPGDITCAWTTGGEWHETAEPCSISTLGWGEGTHLITINATNELGDWDEVTYELTIDDSPPSISLESPAEGAFVSPDDTISVRVDDDNLGQVTYSLWGETRTAGADVAITLRNSPADGYFTVSVAASDLAGNSASGSYIFAMDSQAPVITIEGPASAGAVAEGGSVPFSVTDAYLNQVMWSLDGARTALVTAPYSADLFGVAPGWHTLQIVATDMSGQVGWLNRSVYVDGENPCVTLQSDCSFDPDGPAEIAAVATDDFGIDAVTLYYERDDGSFASEPMVGAGGVFTASLDPSLLWDGMRVYVSVCDVAGNEGSCEPVTISVSDDLADYGTSGDDPGDDEPAWGVSMLAAGAVGAAVALLLLLHSRGWPMQARDNARRPSAARHIRSARPRTTEIRRPGTAGQAPVKARSTKNIVVKNGVVYCRPVRVPPGRVVRRPQASGQAGRTTRPGPGPSAASGRTRGR